MLTRRNLLAVAAAAVAATTLAGTPALAAPVVTVPGYQFDLLGTTNLPGSLSYTGVAGFTGIDFDPASNRAFLLSGDRSDRQPARFYSASLAVSPTGCKISVSAGVNTLKRPDGTPYPKSSVAGQDLVDPQAIRYDAAAGNVLWASAGDRAKSVDPVIRRATTTGGFVAELPRTPNEQVAATTGPRAGGGYSGLAVSTDGAFVISALRRPLLQDGDTAVRVTYRERESGQPVVQFAYPLDTLAGNGVAEVLSVDETRILVLEQAPLADGGNSVRLYEVDPTLGATNLLSEEAPAALAGADYTPLQKRLLLDFSTLGIGTVQNLQGMTWGPQLADGRRSLVFVSDNGFAASTPTQVVALGVTLS
ncbi:esterase-like activity of phytase family protein [Micromonospora sp. NPDC000089]|uniref:esterase-like activity of phytase family protein n=1 Tax=unclassified Micromonospora TaxID=2617518 RepID=UPI0036CC6309